MFSICVRFHGLLQRHSSQVTSRRRASGNDLQYPNMDLGSRGKVFDNRMRGMVGNCERATARPAPGPCSLADRAHHVRDPERSQGAASPRGRRTSCHRSPRC